MRIAVNTRFLIKDKMEGFGWFTHEVFKRIVSQHPEHEFIFLFDRAFHNDFKYAPNVTAIKLNPPARHPWLFYLWFEYAVPKALKKYKADIFISPDGFLSLSTNKPSICVMHDLNFEHYPADLKSHITRYYRKNFPKFAKKADQIITVSEYSKNDIAQLYSIPKNKITVAYNGADESFVKSSDADSILYKKKINAPEPYFLSVGSIHTRKNITRLLQAFDLFKEQNNCNWKLVLVGSKYNWTPQMNAAYQNLKFQHDVIFTGHLPKAELILAYSSANALIFPSYFEGFGIPLIEAMRCECAVLCANTTSFPEVAGNAALYFDPFSVEDMAAVMGKFMQDESIQKDLIEKGKKRVLDFNWQNTADKVWNVIETTAHAQGLLS